MPRPRWQNSMCWNRASPKAGRCAMTLLLSLIGFFTSAFFLSRSYVIVLYLLAALVVAHYTDMRREDPGLPRFPLMNDLLLWPFLGVGAAIGLYVMVKVLLVIQ
jgi:putative inorganic carbon (hco3(-)) transporter